MKSGSVIYISHGGGPLPLLGDEGHKNLIANLEQLAAMIEKPSAIVVVSAHWEEKIATITSVANPPLIYDYYGFPPESYEIRYPTPGAPDLAKSLFKLLKENHIEAALDEHRGFDHGLFIPLKIMFPSADIPCVQVSLISGLNPAEHIRMGNALTGLSKENVLIIGSGFSFHNIRAFFQPSTDESRRMNTSFEEWLISTCSDKNLTETERAQQLMAWKQAPFARYCHPREEHLMPLHVCYGIARAPARQVFRFEVMNKKASAYMW